jgi:hypothetical protein
MSSAEVEYGDLPAALQTQLEQFCADLGSALGDGLVSVAVYGSIAKSGAAASDNHPVRVLLVLQDASTQHLSKISGLIQRAIKSFHAAPFVVSLHDLQTSTDIFPIKFLDMQTHHFLLSGRDVLSELEISTQHLRLRCEQELCNLMLRLRNVFLRNAGNEASLAQAVSFAVTPFFTALGAAVSLTTGLLPDSEREIADSAAHVMSLDREVLERLLTFEDSRRAGQVAALTDLFNAFISVVETAANFVDRLDDEPLSAS